MRKMIATGAMVAATLILFNCKPDPKALEQAKQEGIKIGLDSAAKILAAIDTTHKSHYKPNQKKFTHPSFPGHVHDGIQKWAASSGGNFKQGVLAITDNGHTSSNHKVVGYIPFVNPKGVTMMDSDRLPRPNHKHFKYENVMTYIIDDNGNIIDSIQVAIIDKRY